MQNENEIRPAAKRAGVPNPLLRSLDRLVGTWKVSGPEVDGEITFEWLEGGFFFVHRGWVSIWGRTIKFVEYIGYGDETHSCSSHLFDNFGDLFTYVWEVDGDSITTWFGRKGSDNCFRGKFSPDGRRYSGAWKWPGGGYEAIVTKL